MIRILVCVVFVLPGSVAAVPAGEDKAAAGGPVLLPGEGVTDAEGKVGYLPNPAGGIDALNLAAGKVLWQSKEGPRPLLVKAGKLYVQAPLKGKANQVRIVVLDATQEGKRLLESGPVVFPDWVVVGVAHGRSFRSAAQQTDAGLMLTWEARAWYAGGAAPPKEVEAAARKSANGAALIDPRTGTVKAIAADKPRLANKPQAGGTRLFLPG